MAHMAISVERIGEMSSKMTITAWFIGLAWMAFLTDDAIGVSWWEWIILVVGGMFAASIVIGGGLALVAAAITKMVTGKSEGSPHAFAWAALIAPWISFFATGPAVRFFA